MTVVYDTTEAMAVGNVTAQLINVDSGFVRVGPLLSVPAHEDGSWSIELTPNDASIGFSSVWYVTMQQENVPPTSWILNVPVDGPVLVGALDYAEQPNQGIGVEQIQAGSGISIDPPDGTGIVTITNTGGGGQLPVYSDAANIQITSTAGYIDITATLDELMLRGTPITLDYGAGNYLHIFAADVVGNLPDPGANVPATGYTASDALTGGSSNGAPAQFVWNTTFSQWQPVPQNIGNVAVGPSSTGVTFPDSGVGLALFASPYTPNQPVGLVSNGPPSAFGTSQYLTFGVGATLAVAVDQSLTLIATGSVATPAWDYVDIQGTVTVTDLTGLNYIVCTYTQNQLRSDTSSFNATLTQTAIGGTDLSTDGTNIISAAGGVYNVSLSVIAYWD